mgnify:CR=1 FL=1
MQKNKNHTNVAIKIISKSFGITFQLADDIEDLIQDQKRQNDRSQYS